jgi:hypothetical protein
MQYLTFQEYAELGGNLEENAFNRNIDRACGVIDNATHGRVDKMAKTPASVKALCRDLVEYFAAGYGSSKQVTSHNQSAGSVSEGESFSIRSTEERAGEIEDMVCDYLLNVTDDNGTPLLYRGCSR